MVGDRGGDGGSERILGSTENIGAWGESMEEDEDSGDQRGCRRLVGLLSIREIIGGHTLGSRQIVGVCAKHLGVVPQRLRSRLAPSAAEPFVDPEDDCV